HHMRCQPTDSARFRCPLQPAQVAVGRTDVWHKDRIVEVKDERDTSGVDPALEDRRSEQGCLAKNIHRIVVSDGAQDSHAADERTPNQSQFLLDVPWLVEQRVEFFTVERMGNYLYSPLPQQWLPLLHPEALAWGCIVETRNKSEEPHWPYHPVSIRCVRIKPD